jgi:heme exporter protein A
VQGLTRRFGRREVLRGVDLSVAPGGFLLVLGANGAGKTTLLRILATLLRPGAGRVTVAGTDVGEEPEAVRRSVGFVGHAPLLYGDLTLGENLRFFAAAYGIGSPAKRIAEVVDGVELSLRYDDPVRELSRGMRQRAALARALLHRPSVLLLDEPYAALDERARVLLDGILDEESGGTTIVLVTHEPERPLRWATETVRLEDGVAVPADGRGDPSGGRR